ncbi:MAG: hypothetical protein IPI93_07445 [Sphingobacteriaceae bacterium]|nr:hypothetical protein [Sphingobacteriaceae bacterium]
MNRSFSYSILFLICLVFTRCSWIEEFVIINESDKAIYVKYEIAENSKFINGRTFNLKQLQILSNNKIIDVVPDTFDDHFKKHRGQIRFVSK